jgi:hypothetical protein
MPGNPREIITAAERRYPYPGQDRRSARRSRPAVLSNHGLARWELWLGRLGNDTVGHPRRAQRRRFDLFRRCHARQRLRRALVRRVKDRDGRGRVPSAR